MDPFQALVIFFFCKIFNEGRSFVGIIPRLISLFNDPGCSFRSCRIEMDISNKRCFKTGISYLTLDIFKIPVPLLPGQ